MELARQVRKNRQLRSEDLDRQITASTCEHLRRAHLNRLREGELNAWQIRHGFAELLDQPGLVLNTPLAFWLQDEKGVRLIWPHGIETELVGADARNDAFDLGNLLLKGPLDPQITVDAGLEIDRGVLCDLHDHRPFIHGRHEDFADGTVRDDDQADTERGQPIDRERKGETGLEQRPISAGQHTHQERF